jgi:hypothetical protein
LLFVKRRRGEARRRVEGPDEEVGDHNSAVDA